MNRGRVGLLPVGPEERPDGSVSKGQDGRLPPGCRGP